MNTIYTQSNKGTSEPEEKKEKKWRVLVILLFVLMMITTGFVGYIVGKGSRFSDNMSGKAIDTIHVTKPEAQIHLGGKIFYSDGSPYAKGIVQLHSEPRQTITDEAGAFVFENAEGGTHIISIVDRAGNVLAEREVIISKKDIEEGAKIKLLKDDVYQVEVAVDIKYLEVQVEINKEDGKLYINPDRVTYLTEGGMVVSPTGKADIRNGVVVTPVGNVITTDGTIICGSGENQNQKVIIPSGNLITRDDGTIETPDGTQVKTDGTVVSNNTVIDTKGVSLTPDGNRQEPGDGGYQILREEDNIKQVPLGKETEELIENNGAQESGGQDENNSVNGNVSGSDTPGNERPSGGTPGTGGTSGGAPDKDTPSDDVPEQPDDIGPDNGVAYTGGVSEDELDVWVQNTEIDLFYNRTDGAEGRTVLSPGAEGYYLFQISNDNHFSISLNLSVREEGLHLPLEFAIADKDGKLLTAWTASAGASEAVTDKIVLDGRGKNLYQIKWRWPYDSGDAQNAIDTQIGELEDRSYTVNLSIRVEER